MITTAGQCSVFPAGCWEKSLWKWTHHQLQLWEMSATEQVPVGCCRRQPREGEATVPCRHKMQGRAPRIDDIWEHKQPFYLVPLHLLDDDYIIINRWRHCNHFSSVDDFIHESVLSQIMWPIQVPDISYLTIRQVHGATVCVTNLVIDSMITGVRWRHIWHLIDWGCSTQ